MMTRLKEEMSIAELIKIGTVIVGLTVLVVTLRSSDMVQNKILDKLQGGQTDHERRITEIERIEREEGIFEAGRKVGLMEAAP